MGMKLSDYIAIIAKVIENEGDLHIDRLIMDNKEFCVVKNHQCFTINDYKQDIIDKIIKKGD